MMLTSIISDVLSLYLKDLPLCFPPSLCFKLAFFQLATQPAHTRSKRAKASERSSMANAKAKLSDNAPESTKSEDESSPSSGFTFESDSLPIEFSDAWFGFQADILSKQIDEVVLKYNNCFVCLQETIAEENLLQDENLKLRAENLYLSILVTAKENEIIEASMAKSGGKFAPESEDSSAGEKIAIRDKVADTMTRGILPKAISVRSAGFLEVMNKGKNLTGAGGDSVGIGAAESNRQPQMLRLVAKPFKNGDGVEEVHVYKQGMSKTELCNKWEETGSCPYEERCHFAHGVEELRPVLRHPRYKTEICRMITSGGTCPYGHRCHFRHSLDPNQEKEVVI